MKTINFLLVHKYQHTSHRPLKLWTTLYFIFIFMVFILNATVDIFCLFIVFFLLRQVFYFIKCIIGNINIKRVAGDLWADMNNENKWNLFAINFGSCIEYHLQWAIQFIYILIWNMLGAVLLTGKFYDFKSEKSLPGIYLCHKIQSLEFHLLGNPSRISSHNTFRSKFDYFIAGL